MSKGPAAIILAVIRHAPTAYNEAGRIQGRHDVPLSAAGRAAVAKWQLPPALNSGYAWKTSPLLRCRETAAKLGIPNAGIEPALIEMDWGEWEGRTLDDLRRELGEAMTMMEAKGLDFRPPGGESPRNVQARLYPWLRALAQSGRNTAAVTHKGVIRALYAAATGWPMLGKAPDKLNWCCAHLFAIAPDGRPAVHHLNLPLDRP